MEASIVSGTAVERRDEWRLRIFRGSLYVISVLASRSASGERISSYADWRLPVK